MIKLLTTDLTPHPSGLSRSARYCVWHVGAHFPPVALKLLSHVASYCVSHYLAPLVTAFQPRRGYLA
jgi:hypothetical protein